MSRTQEYSSLRHKYDHLRCKVMLLEWENKRLHNKFYKRTYEGQSSVMRKRFEENDIPRIDMLLEKASLNTWERNFMLNLKSWGSEAGFLTGKQKAILDRIYKREK